ncbi:MAG TPA: maleylpyruvate isomerase N-terminal domain-containing protein, partial [Ilumatobacteraceae bacterium]
MGTALDDVLHDLVAEYDRLELILAGVTPDQWSAPSGAPGWTVRDVVIHLAQTEEGVRLTLGAPVGEWTTRDQPLDEAVDARVRADDTPPAE